MVELEFSARAYASRLARGEWSAYSPISISLDGYVERVLPALSELGRLLIPDANQDIAGVEVVPRDLAAAFLAVREGERRICVTQFRTKRRTIGKRGLQSPRNLARQPVRERLAGSLWRTTPTVTLRAREAGAVRRASTAHVRDQRRFEGAFGSRR
ncbi:MAG: DUF2750 domain-containing protein, partial [Polyangiales bacterium]